MRAINTTEMDAVNGGFSFFGITEIEVGLKLLGQVRAVTGYAAAAYTAGYAVGSLFNAVYEWAAGDTLGGDLYDLKYMLSC